MLVKTARIAELDLLRFVAALGVVVYHFGTTPMRNGGIAVSMFPSLSTLVRYGYLGVDLFFLISGFVIVTSARRTTPRAFLLHRALRLYPAFLAALVLTTLAIGAFEDIAARPSLSLVLKNASMLPQYLGAARIDDVYWTLAVELKFYALVALVLALGLRNQIEFVATGWIACLAALHFGLPSKILSSVAMYPHGTLFATGVILAYIYSDGLTLRRCVTLSVSAALSIETSIEAIDNFVVSIRAVDGVIVAGVVLAMILVFLWISRYPNRTRGAAKLSFLGALTYPLYLMHSRIGRAYFLAAQEYMSAQLAMATELVLVLLLSWALWRVVECNIVPIIRRSRTFSFLEGRELRESSRKSSIPTLVHET
jgi:peptidoglycan/LPS O-acetylase OafA/YrhL